MSFCKSFTYILGGFQLQSESYLCGACCIQDEVVGLTLFKGIDFAVIIGCECATDVCWLGSSVLEKCY